MDRIHKSITLSTYKQLGDGADSYEMPKSPYTPQDSSYKASKFSQREFMLPETNYTDNLSSNTPNPSQNPVWRPGFLKRFPWLGLGALLISLICIAMATVVLLKSDGQSLERWDLQPSVVLSIISAIFKLALGYAFAQGAVIFWWNRALKGSTVKDLHRIWGQGQELKAALLSGRNVNLVAIATCVVTLCAAVGPLLQRATTVVVATNSASINLTGHIASELPEGYTALFSPGSSQFGGVTLAFSRVLKEYDQGTPMTSDLSGCHGNCSTVVEAAGIVAICGDPVVSNWEINRFSDNSGVPIFQVNSTWEDDGDSELDESLERITLSIGIAGNISSHAWSENLNVPTQNCTGKWTVTTCNLTQAVVSYPVNINPSGVITLNTTNSNLTQVSDGPKYRWSQSEPGIGSTIGGLSLYLSDRTFANASLSQLGLNRYHAPPNFPSDTLMSNFSINNFGTFASQHFTSDNITSDRCDYTWSDPTNDILKRVNEIMLRTALQTGRENPDGIRIIQGTVDGPTSGDALHPTAQNIRAQQTTTATIHHTQVAYLVAALIVMLAGIVSVVPLYGGFWQLGRDVSFNPLEVGKAFDAPVLDGSTDLMSEIGGRQIVFGEMDGSGGRKLVFGAPGVVRKLVRK